MKEQLYLLELVGGLMIILCKLYPRGKTGKDEYPEIEYRVGHGAKSRMTAWGDDSQHCHALKSVRVLHIHAVAGLVPEIGGIYANNTFDSMRILDEYTRRVRRVATHALIKVDADLPRDVIELVVAMVVA